MNNLSQEWIAHTILSWQGDHYTAAELIWKNIQIETKKLQEEAFNLGFQKGKLSKTKSATTEELLRNFI